MAYPRELLNDGEELSLDLRPHWWYFAKNFLGGFFLIIFLIMIAFLPDGSAGAQSGSSDNLFYILNKYILIIWFIAMVVWACVLSIAYLQWIFTLFVVTSDRVIYRSGIIAKRGIEIPLERINNINFIQSVFERVIGAGTLEIESAGETGKSVFRDVRHPDAVAQEINRCREENDRKTARYSMEGLEDQLASGLAHGGGPMSIPEQIEKLAQLRDQNIITEAEFLDKRQKLLDQM